MLKTFGFCITLFLAAFSAEALDKGTADSRIFSADELRELTKMMASPELSDAEKLATLTDRRREARLRQLPYGLRFETRSQMMDWGVSFYNSSNPEYPFTLNSVRAVLPSEFKGTALVEVLRAHEEQHRVQSALATVWSYLKTSQFARETDAMEEEWEIAHLLTPEMIAHSMQAIQNARLSDFDRFHLTSILEHAHLSRKDYLKAERKNNRHTRMTLLKRGLAWGLIPASAATSGAIVYGVVQGTLSICRALF